MQMLRQRRGCPGRGVHRHQSRLPLCCTAGSAVRVRAGAVCTAGGPCAPAVTPCQCGTSGGTRGRGAVAAAAARSAKRLKYAGVGQRLVSGDPLFVTLEPDGGDAWRLERVAQLLRDGGVGIVPTDSLPAVVCDLENRDAVLRLFACMQLSPKKRLSVLCRNFQDISHYTAGFRPPTQPGQPDTFTVVRRMLPGPFTLIMPASKNLPATSADDGRGRRDKRKSVGVRMPADPVCRALLDGFGGCLLSHSVHVLDRLDEETEVPDPGTLLDMYGSSGIDFVVDTGPRVATPSTVIDLTGPEPELVRQGKGDASPLIGAAGS